MANFGEIPHVMKRFLPFLAVVALNAGASVIMPYSSGEEDYTVLQLEGAAEVDGDVWDLSRMAVVGEIPLRFEQINDSVFTATTNDTRQTFTHRAKGLYLTRSETPFTVGFLEPGEIVKGEGEAELTMRGRTHIHDYYYGTGRAEFGQVRRGTLIRRDDDTIANVALERRETVLRVAMDLHPIKSLDAFADSLICDYKATTYTWRDSRGVALAQTIAWESGSVYGQSEPVRATFLIIDNTEPVSYEKRRHSGHSGSLSVSLGDNSVTITGLDADYGEAQISIADVAGRLYYSGKVDSHSGMATIKTQLPPDEVIVSVTQAETTSFKLIR